MYPPQSANKNHCFDCVGHAIGRRTFPLFTRKRAGASFVYLPNIHIYRMSGCCWGCRPDTDYSYSYSPHSTHESDFTDESGYSSFTEESEYRSFSSDDSSSEEEHYRRPHRFRHLKVGGQLRQENHASANGMNALKLSVVVALLALVHNAF